MSEKKKEKRVHLLTKETTCIETVMLLDRVFPSAEIYDKEFFFKLKKSLEEEGLLRPLVVTPMTVREWRMLQEGNPDLLPPPNRPDDEVVFQVRCGNNRYYAAKEMGYKYITVAYTANLKEASQMCRKQQREMKKWQEETERWGS